MTLLTPEFLQTKTYSALRDRLAFSHGGPVQEGVWDTGDLKAAQRAAGANMSVDVAAGSGLVAADDPGNLGLYHVQNDATVNVPQPTAAHATLPRIDSLYLQVQDTTHGGDAADQAIFGWATGTATSGATLDNRTGATAIPTGAILLADVLVPAAATTMTTANIRDRRPWARGAFSAFTYVGGDIVNTGGYATMPTVFTSRIECGVSSTFRIRFSGGLFGATVGVTGGVEIQTGAGSPGVQQQFTIPVANSYVPFNVELAAALSAGSHLIAFQFYNLGGGNLTIKAGTTGTQNPYMTIEEVVRGNTNNN